MHQPSWSPWPACQQGGSYMQYSFHLLHCAEEDSHTMNTQTTTTACGNHSSCCKTQCDKWAGIKHFPSLRMAIHINNNTCILKKKSDPITYWPPLSSATSATTLVSIWNTQVFRTALTALTEPRTLWRRMTPYPSPRWRVALHTYLLYFWVTYTHHQKDKCVTLFAVAAVMLKQFFLRPPLLWNCCWCTWKS